MSAEKRLLEVGHFVRSGAGQVGIVLSNFRFLAATFLSSLTQNSACLFCKPLVSSTQWGLGRVPSRWIRMRSRTSKESFEQNYQPSLGHSSVRAR